MKKIFTLCLFVSFFCCSCKQKEIKSPIEGAWKLVYMYVPSSVYVFPQNVTGEDLKIWTKTHFSFDGSFKVDTGVIDSYGWGTYTLNGNRYVETIKLHTNKASIGNVVNMLLEIRNDTLIQRFPADENFNLRENCTTEKYIKLE